jgi:hypothetical protein
MNLGRSFLVFIFVSLLVAFTYPVLTLFDSPLALLLYVAGLWISVIVVLAWWALRSKDSRS